MSFRRRLLLLFAVTVLVSVLAVAWIISALARHAFDRANDERTTALVAQFQKEFARRGTELSRRIAAAASSTEAQRIAIAIAQQQPNYSPFLDDAQLVAQDQELNFLEFTDEHGTIISSAQSPAKFGYKETLVDQALPNKPFLKQEEMSGGSALGLFSIQVVPQAGHKLVVIGGLKLDRNFLSSIALPSGMRVMLYEGSDGGQDVSPEHLITAGASLEDLQPISAVIREVQEKDKEARQIVHWRSGPDEMVNA